MAQGEDLSEDVQHQVRSTRSVGIDFPRAGQFYCVLP